MPSLINSAAPAAPAPPQEEEKEPVGDFTVTVPDGKVQKIAVKVPTTGEKLRLQVFLL